MLGVTYWPASLTLVATLYDFETVRVKPSPRVSSVPHSCCNKRRQSAQVVTVIHWSNLLLPRVQGLAAHCMLRLVTIF